MGHLVEIVSVRLARPTRDWIAYQEIGYYDI